MTPALLVYSPSILLRSPDPEELRLQIIRQVECPGGGIHGQEIPWNNFSDRYPGTIQGIRIHWPVGISRIYFGLKREGSIR